jgi:hypothetical protein
MSSFIEENHDHKLARQANQSKQVSLPGRPSQDMMSYWGSCHTPWNKWREELTC